MKLVSCALAIFLGTALIAFSGEPVQAGDLPQGLHDWSGRYLGVSVGTGGGDFDGSHDDGRWQDVMKDGGGPFSMSASGALGGVQLGYNWQSGNVVYGLEGNISVVGWSDGLNNAAAFSAARPSDRSSGPHAPPLCR